VSLTTKDHARDVAGYTYVYPVVSRRARGVSVGINLNTNRACNWRCVYCQVPGLVLGEAPPTDLSLLERELRAMLGDIVSGDYLVRHVPEESRRLNDVAFSGNGEPTSAKDFDQAVDVVGRVLSDLGLVGKVAVVLITNGSLIHRPGVLRGLEAMAALGGEVWFKLDSATEEGRARLNGTTISGARIRENLKRCAALCPTRLQTILVGMDGEGPSAQEQDAWLDFVRGLLEEGTPIRDVLLYGLERVSHQPEADRLFKLEPAVLEAFAERVRSLGLPVSVHP
jgi:wyosine [tRNA(Phe)-imidazoG37] synthetase (radical SAM superfamily)